MVLALGSGCPEEASTEDPPASTATETAADGGASAADGGACEDTPDFEGVCEECLVQLIACYAPPCDFEYDPNDCVNTTLSFPKCDCVQDTDTGGTTTGGDPDTGTGSGTSTGADTASGTTTAGDGAV